MTETVRKTLEVIATLLEGAPENEKTYAIRVNGRWYEISTPLENRAHGSALIKTIGAYAQEKGFYPATCTITFE